MLHRGGTGQKSICLVFFPERHAYWSQHSCDWQAILLAVVMWNTPANELTHGKESFLLLVCTEAKPRGFILCCLHRKATDRGFPRDCSCSHCLLQMSPGATYPQPAGVCFCRSPDGEELSYLGMNCPPTVKWCSVSNAASPWRKMCCALGCSLYYASALSGLNCSSEDPTSKQQAIETNAAFRRQTSWGGVRLTASVLRGSGGIN